MINVTTERKKQIEYTGLTEQDLKLLADCRPIFQKVVDEVVDRFYDHVGAQPELVSLIARVSDIERLKETQKGYWLSLADGTIDQDVQPGRAAALKSILDEYAA
ncbi:protoglobin domain-containing protein [Paenibacillus arenilitoris]|uniref:Globin-sensor domain-containing protein n=1 Tax=Paenibacillus arenilitoris TaxID=2772299 RepID=A0A927CRC8_9BACL|nr:protoglobin domain-containing protein [Paenibacillus arenilitoris]MBD2872100.1 hypothetical protein [Paenibacillus arenilitoris]